MYKKFESLLERNNVKAGTVASATGIDRGTFTHWKNGRYSPKADKLQKIADYFNVPLSYFYGEDEDELPADERKILNLYRELNDEGKELLIDYAGMLQKKYTEDTPCEVSA